MYVRKPTEYQRPMTAWDIVPEEKARSSRSQGLICSKYGIPNGTGMYMCRFIKRSMIPL